MSLLDKVQLGSNESPGVQAIQEARRKVMAHIGSTSKELGNIAAQYGKLIGNYQAELQQLDASLARLQPVSALRGYNDAQQCGQGVNENCSAG